MIGSVRHFVRSPRRLPDLACRNPASADDDFEIAEVARLLFLIRSLRRIRPVFLSPRPPGLVAGPD
jgi:hypothetical protein